MKELVEKSQDQVADLVADSKEKINEAASITEVCHKTFQGIITEVSEVFDAVHAIAKASKEQAHGIESITIAMEQIDTGIQQISTVAKQGQVLSANLNDNAGQLHESSNELQKFIKGKNFHKAS